MRVKRKSAELDVAKLEAEYRTLRPDAERFLREVVPQLTRSIEQEGIALGFPLYHRVKDWMSIVSKLERQPLAGTSIRDYQDLIGLRIVLLFRRDVEAVKTVIRNHFHVVREYDTQARLGDDRFGYASYHFVVKLRAEWLAVPTLAGLGDWSVEIQVRTVAQHMWAEASQKLQYKRSDTVPAAVHRSLSRASALLETVDLEFERVLNDRQEYRETDLGTDATEELNVDLLEKILDSSLPKANKGEDESYAELLEDIRAMGLTKVSDLATLVKAQLAAALKSDKARVDDLRDNPENLETGEDEARLARGVFYTHEGLVRQCLPWNLGKNSRTEACRRL